MHGLAAFGLFEGRSSGPGQRIAGIRQQNGYENGTNCEKRHVRMSARVRTTVGSLVVVVAFCGLAASASPASAWQAANEGQSELDKATELHLSAQSLRDLEEVLALCERALRKGLDSDNQKLAHQLAASCLYQRGSSIAAAIVDRDRPSARWPQLREIALNDLEKAVEHNPDLTEGYELICKLVLLPGGDREQGLKAATELVRLLPQDKGRLAEAYLWRARFRESADQRLADLDAAAAADPDNVDIWKLRAAVLYENGDFEKAADAFRKLAEESPDNAALQLALAEALANMDDKYDEALQHIERAIELEPESNQAYLLRARLRAMKEQVAEAIGDLDKALEINRDDVTALLLRAELHLFQDDYSAAKADVDRALNERPGLVLAILLRSRINAAEKKFEQAIEDMRLLIDNDPTNADYKLQMAAYYTADERPRKAIKLLTELIEQDEDNWRALRSRGDALLSVGKHAEAIEDFDSALKLQPEDSGLLNNLAWVLATSPEDALRNGQRAIELAEKAAELTEFKEAHILSTLASGYAEVGDYDKAVEWARKAVEAGEGEIKDQLQKELDSYLAKKPWREKQEVKEKPDIPRGNLLET